MRLSNTLIYAMFIAAPSWATTIIGNLGSADAGEYFVCCRVSLGVGFTMNSGPDFTLDMAKATVIIANGAVFSAELYGTSGGNPVGPALVDFTSPGFVGGPGIQTIDLVPTSAFTLQASTTYWLVLTGGYEWRDTNGVPTGLFATDAGTREDSNLPPQNVVGPEHPLFEISGTAIGPAAGVPEPGTVGLVSLTLLGLLWARRRRITL
jgi:hypothetical protein